MKKITFIKLLTGFFILFALYHTAEYMMLFENNITGFLFFQGLFFTAAWIVAKWLTGKGFTAWGLAVSKKNFKALCVGLVAGFAVYLVYFFTSLELHVVEIVQLPSFKTAAVQFCYLGFGTALTSLSEDVFTRGYLYRFLHRKLDKKLLVVFSAFIYVLNHIHRLQDGWQLWVYLFIIGVFLMTAFVNTGSIWMTFGLHWSGNMVYHSTNTIISSKDGIYSAYGIYLYIFFLLVLVPVTIIISRKIKDTAGKQQPSLQHFSNKNLNNEE